MRTRLNRLILCFLGIMMTMTLTGCDGKIEEVVDNWEGELKARIEANQGEVEKIYKAGLLSEEQAKSLKEAIGSQQSRILNMTGNDGKQYVIDGAGLAKEAGNGDKAKGVEIISIDNDAIKELMNNLDFEVYVLKKDPLNTGKGENSLATLDLIATEVEKAKEGKPSNIDSYFINSGRKVWDTSKPENLIIKETVPSGKYTDVCGCPVDDGALTDNVNVLGQHFIGVKTHYDDSEEHEHKHSDSILEMKITEFNPDAVTRLVGADGVNKDVYVIVGKKCYLMQYPVQYVTGFKKEGNDFIAQYEESDMQINILTKSLMDKSGRVCTTTAGDILKATGTGGYSELGEASFVIDGIQGPVTKFGYDPNKKEQTEDNKDGASSETDENTEEKEALPVNADKFGRVILRDYLELNYMPTVVDGENLVALGRRVRLINFKGTGQDTVGLFVDKSGNEIQNSLRIKITDLMDITSGSSDKEGKRIKLDLKAEESDSENTDSTDSTDSTGNTDSDTSNVFEIGQSQSNLLETEYASEIKVSTKFPGTIVATSDDLKLGVVAGEATEDGNETEGEQTEETEQSATSGSSEKIKHFMYGMAIDIDPFQSNMFSGWIEITGDNGDIGSLDWWNDWLAESTYRYHIDRDKVINFLTGNYMYEMRENGSILLDIPTIANIQKQYNLEDKIAGANLITTIFTVLGFIVIAYSSLMLAAWVYDTNIVAGPRLMGLFSFGRWEAISGDDEMPYMDTQQKHYMTFGKTLKACVILIGVGVLIVFVDILHIVDILILLFGKIAEIFGNVIQGIGM